MLNGIKNKVEDQLHAYARELTQTRRLSAVSYLLHGTITDFILRPGKRIRPVLFVLGYRAYSRRPAAGLYRSAMAFELLHDFMLVHDDIIDRSALRRGKPAMHASLAAHFRKVKLAKFTGQDLAIVAGDILYAMAVEAFLSIREQPQRKEAALKKFIDAAFFTGCGEFAELELGTKPVQRLEENDIYTIYDLKTAFYSFAYPLSIGATLAGAPVNEVRKLFRYGICLGRAFQITDDILGMFAEESQTGKSALSDLSEAKRTLLIWHAFSHSSPKLKKKVKELLNKKTITGQDLRAMRILLVTSGALEYCHRQVKKLSGQAERAIASLAVSEAVKESLERVGQMILL